MSASRHPTPAPATFPSASSETERRPLSQYMQVGSPVEEEDGGWTIFDSADATAPRAAQSRLDLSVLKEIKNFLATDDSTDDDSFFGDETLIETNEVRVAYPFYDGAPSTFNAAERENVVPSLAPLSGNANRLAAVSVPLSDAPPPLGKTAQDAAFLAPKTS
ncbi:MAG: hypothetical protein IJE97_07750, partial [Thermoguttaceae bacterium]|nr:hypothetical protein [Thermoguttaceae bacterium]